MAKSAAPEGYNSITPYLVVDDGKAALEFYKSVFGADVFVLMDGPNGTVGHAELRVGDSVFMLADQTTSDFKSPVNGGEGGVFLMIYVEDVDEVFPRAISAGGKELKPLQDQFYGDRSGTFQDPFGHIWTLATHKEDVSPEEMERRMKEIPPMEN